MLDGTEHRVVGVLSPAFDFPFIGLGGDAWVPLALDERSSHLPVSVIARLNAAIAEILRTREIGELWASQGMKVVSNTPEQFAQRVRADYEKYGRIVKAVGIRPE